MMRKRVAKWLLLFTLATPTLYVGCPASIGLKVLDTMMSGLYSGAQVWTTGVMMDFLESLQQEPEPAPALEPEPDE